MRNLAQVRVTHEFMTQALGLCAGVRVVEVYQTPQDRVMTQTFTVLVEGPGVPPIPEGSAVPFLGPNDLRRDTDAG
jgi:hypothetical protein